MNYHQEFYNHIALNYRASNTRACLAFLAHTATPPTAPSTAPVAPPRGCSVVCCSLSWLTGSYDIEFTIDCKSSSIVADLWLTFLSGSCFLMVLHCLNLRLFALIDSSMMLFPKKKSVATMFANPHHSSRYHLVT